MSEPRLVRTLTPIDLSSVDDRNIQALIALAVSLGWNVHQKHNQPVTVSARDGTQKRLPTDTSVRMSMFQQVLSTILLHTDSEQWIPGTELAEALISEFKLDHEHARRVRLSVTAPREDHENQIAAMQSEAAPPRQDAPVTQRLEVPTVEFVETLPGAQSPGTEPKPLTTRQILREQAKVTLDPPEPQPNYPTRLEAQAWADQVATLPHVDEVGKPHSRKMGDGMRRVFLSRMVKLDNGETVSHCGWPGCRKVTEGRLQGHINSHMIGASKTTSMYERIQQGVEASPSEPEASPPETRDDEHLGIVDRYANSAIALLDIANQFVADLDKLDSFLTNPQESKKMRERIAELEAENAELRAKYDRLREVLG
jgi:hypothetical protein